jgi:hypothetical protein
MFYHVFTVTMFSPLSVAVTHRLTGRVIHRLHNPSVVLRTGIDVLRILK